MNDLAKQIKNQLKLGVVVMWNDGTDRYRKINFVNKNDEAFFENSTTDYVDLDNVSHEDLLFLLPVTSSKYEFCDACGRKHTGYVCPACGLPHIEDRKRKHTGYVCPACGLPHIEDRK